MGECIICGKAVDGRVCDTHEEDVVFQFRGRTPDELTPGRYYEGTVDGYADFGVFVDVGEHVTGLLHESELDRRLDSLDWEPGDTVYVKVQGIRDNGNVDLGWSIRQRESDFRGTLVDDPGADEPEREPEAADESTAPDESEAADESTAAGANAGREPTAGTAGGVTANGGSGSDDGGATAATPSVSTPPDRVEVASLSDRVGERVRIEGEVVGVRQTGGPTVFEVRDETGAVDVAAFEAAGVRAYPEVVTDDLVRVVGTVEVRRDELQVESESVERLEDDDGRAVRDRLEAALIEEAEPGAVELLADHEPVAAVREEIREAATAIRRAVFETRPVVVRHTATADGYAAAAAIERAVLPLVREEHARSDAEYHFFDRRPLDGPSYTVDAATDDVTDMLEDRDRHDEKLPLVVLVDLGTTAESDDGRRLLSVYDVESLVIDTDDPAPGIDGTVVNPRLSDAGGEPTATALAANVAVHVDPDAREDLAHLPAVSYWADVPDAYAELAADAGYTLEETTRLREAVALEAYYQSYEDKRELIADLLFGERGSIRSGPAAGAVDAADLAAHLSEQFRDKLADAIDPARANAEVREGGGVRFTVLDADAFAHRFDFPPTALLADELHRREDGAVTLVVGDDELYLRGDDALDVRAIAEAVDEAVPEGGVRAIGGRDGRLQFLAGEREAVLEATVEAVADALG